MGLSDAAFDELFATDKPVIFGYYGYPMLIHRLTYRRTNHGNIHVRGFKEEGTTTPFHMTVCDELDRFRLFADVVDRVPKLHARAAYAKQFVREQWYAHHQYITTYGDDAPAIKNWKWTAPVTG